MGPVMQLFDEGLIDDRSPFEQNFQIKDSTYNAHITMTGSH